MPTRIRKTARVTARLPAPLRQRLAVLSRIIAAVAGGYVLATAATALLPQALAQGDLSGRGDAVLAATLLGIAVHTGATLWVFTASSAGRAWVGLGTPALLLGGVAWLMRGAGMP
ncbi:apolipoprotein N-acyltransferase [Azospirillum agricola]|uniref:DUF3649 domain-containing protein n=1 Tax=Azospirillum agricola TaxID=1720247 RepID=UPI001AE1EBAC|nr:DUF3649 domain-containing protein [Azospirillum agricola]MBP2230857.1 apolipoprotein N-acyltransferase [Azospirillum agricola]